MASIVTFKWTTALCLGTLFVGACAAEAPITSDDDDVGTGTGTQAGTMTGSATGTMTGAATGTETGTMTGTMAGTTTGTMTGTTTGTATGTATGTGGMGGTGGVGGMGGMGGTGGMGGMGGTGGMGGMGGMGGTGGTGGMGGGPLCNTAADCNAAEICDVATEQCVASQCNPAIAQPGGCIGTDPACLQQLDGSGYGACYELCEPYTTACPGSLECVNADYGQAIGICHNAGTGTKGQACNPAGLEPNGWTINSGCAAGHQCLNDGVSDVCFETCDYFNFGSASCPGTDVCQLGGFCDVATNDGYENVPLEGACVGALGGENCGLTGDGYSGACNDFSDGQGMICHAWCTFAHPCPNAAHTCLDIFGPPLQGIVGGCGL